MIHKLMFLPFFFAAVQVLRQRRHISATTPVRVITSRSALLGLGLGMALSASFGTAIAAERAEPTVDAATLTGMAPTPPERVSETFQVRPGFQLQLAAAEPIVADPVALSFDGNGRLFVAEMIGYSERQDERLGRIRMLEDTNGDGIYDKSIVYADQLPWPTAVFCYDGGVFVGATPDILYFKDTDGDDKADERTVVFTGFGAGVERLNVQRLLNSFRWGLDNRIHGANGGNGAVVSSPTRPDAPVLNLGGRDFSFDPKTLEIRAENGGGQNGMSLDNTGRKFVSSNSAHIQMIAHDGRILRADSAYTMPNPLLNIPVDGPSAEVYRISPDEPWRVVRTQWRVAGLVPGPVEGGGRPSGYFTAATGVTIYRGNAWPAEYLGDAFVADCGSNLIHRKKLHPDGVVFTAIRAEDEQTREFAASSDNWFRPVQFANAPDGTLYVADMYRQTIEHPWSLPESIKQHIDLNAGNDRGRIYRIAPIGFQQPATPHLEAASTEELVRTLDHPNGWHRDTAARLIYERQDPAAIQLLEKLITKSNTSLARMHALYSLAGLNALTASHVAAALADFSPLVRGAALRLCPEFLDSKGFASRFGSLLPALINDLDPVVRFQLALVLGIGNDPARIPALTSILRSAPDDPWIRAAVLNSVGSARSGLFAEFARTLEASGPDGNPSSRSHAFLLQLARMIGDGDDSPEISRSLKSASTATNREIAFDLATALLNGIPPSGELPETFGTETRQTLQALWKEASQVVENNEPPQERRAAAARLLGRANWATAGSVLPPLLRPNEPALIQSAAVAALVERQDRGASQVLIDHWKTLTPRLRTQALGALLARSERIPILMSGIQQGIVQPSELTAAQIQFLKGHRNAEVRQQAMQFFASNTPRPRAKVLEEFQPSLTLHGDPTRGRAIYLERCASCHRQGNDGAAVGPDFASVRSNGREKLLISIVDPNREVPPNYMNYTVETRDGESLMGLISNEGGTSITLRRAFGEESVIARTSIETIQTSNQSLMPEGLESTLNSQAMADLLEFMMNGDGAK